MGWGGGISLTAITVAAHREGMKKQKAALAFSWRATQYLGDATREAGLGLDLGRATQVQER